MRLFTLIGRALLLRCPNCGKAPMFHGRLRMWESCPVCGFTFEREPGYFTGSIALSLVTAELGFVFVFVLWAYLTWPNPPWFWLQWGGAAAMVIFPIFAWPFSRSLWLAFDLWVHPVEASDLNAPVIADSSSALPTTTGHVSPEANTHLREVLHAAERGEPTVSP